MRRTPLSLTVLALFTIAPPTESLERRAVRIPEGLEPAQWGASATVTIRYYNYCTGWLWLWNTYDASRSSGLGVCFDTGAESALLLATRELLWGPMPDGYGYTGMIEVLDGCDCDSPVLATQLHVGGTKYGGLQWIERPWGVVVPQNFMVRIRGGASTYDPNGIDSATDHPAPGPTGPAAPGICYPTPRPVQSYLYAFPACTQTPLTDPVGTREVVMEAVVQTMVPVEDSSWGSIKALYR